MLIDILLAVSLVALIGVPAVIVFDKWKKVMDDAEAEEHGEGGDDYDNN